MSERGVILSKCALGLGQVSHGLLEAVDDGLTVVVLQHNGWTRDGRSDQLIHSYLLLKVRAMNIWKYFLDALFLSMADTYIVELQGTK